MTKQVKTILAIAIIIIIAILAIAFWPKQDQPSNTNQPVITEPDDNQSATNPEPTATTTEPETITSDIDTSDWQTYRNEGLNFELKLPPNLLVSEELNDKYNRLVIFEDKDNKGNLFEIRLRSGKNVSLEQYSYLDFPIDSRALLDGRGALIFKAPSGYCDGPGCTYPFITYSIKNNDDFYNIVFYGDTQLSDIKKGILSSFKFIKNN